MYIQVIAYTGNDDAKKFVLDRELTLDNIKVGTLSLYLSPTFCMHILLYLGIGLDLLELLYCIFLMCLEEAHYWLKNVNVWFLRLLGKTSWKTS